MQRMLTIWISAALAVSLVSAGTTWAAVSVQGEVQIIFSPEERRIVREYYSKEIVEKARGQQGKAKGKGKKGLPPGLAKREKLPPGLQKQLQRNGTLPPGLQGKLEPLPQEVEVRLRPLPPDRVRVVIGTDVIILDKTTQKILDIMRDVAILARDIAR
ncbi:MAG: hypothetical protein HY713_06350 [candidate division NC10 bacterium]|nr:hypothetical protein [candidate division NC10 bacterium]